jgi:hypothetical protein
LAVVTKFRIFKFFVDSYEAGEDFDLEEALIS